MTSLKSKATCLSAPVTPKTLAPQTSDLTTRPEGVGSRQVVCFASAGEQPGFRACSLTKRPLCQGG